MTWEALYDFLHIKDFIYFISAPQLQDMLFPVKIVFIFCSIFFLFFVVYFMIKSSWLQHNFLEDMVDFFTWQSFGQREMNKQWERIKKRVESGVESDYKLAIIDADDYLAEVLDNRGYDSEDLKENIEKAGRLIAPILQDVLNAHETRNLIVYNPDYSLTIDGAKKILDTYEAAVKGIGMG